MKKSILFLFFIALAFFGIINVNAATISDDGEYALLLSSDELDPVIDGEYVELIRFNIEDGETTVKVAELTKGIIPFNGKNEFSHWETENKEKVGDELKITDFTKEGTFYKSNGEEIDYTKGLYLSAKFEGKALNETGKYYVVFDAFAGKINNKSQLRIENKSTEFKTINLTNYTPVREGYTFIGWDLNGKIVTSIDSSAFKKGAVVNLTATYTKDTFDNTGIVLILNANGGTIDGKKTNKYDYLGGGNSGTSMSLLPYTPVRTGYTFEGWNTKKDGTGKNYKYIFWRAWDKEDKEYVKDTLLEDGYGYKNLTLYAKWKNNNPAPKPKSVTLSNTSYVYNGYRKAPTVYIKNEDGKYLKKGTDYKVIYQSGRVYVGKYYVQVKYINKYAKYGTKKLYFIIKPKATSIYKIKPSKGKFTVTINKMKTQTSGYQVIYSKNSKFTSAKTYKIKNTYNKVTLKGTSKKKYYVKVRTYKVVKGNTYYSNWSKVKTVVIK